MSGETAGIWLREARNWWWRAAVDSLVCGG
jgi:hypothetical protein